MKRHSLVGGFLALAVVASGCLSTPDVPLTQDDEEVADSVSFALHADEVSSPSGAWIVELRVLDEGALNVTLRIDHSRPDSETWTACGLMSYELTSAHGSMAVKQEWSISQGHAVVLRAAGQSRSVENRAATESLTLIVDSTMTYDNRVGPDDRVRLVLGAGGDSPNASIEVRASDGASFEIAERLASSFECGSNLWHSEGTVAAVGVGGIHPTLILDASLTFRTVGQTTATYLVAMPSLNPNMPGSGVCSTQLAFNGLAISRNENKLDHCIHDYAGPGGELTLSVDRLVANGPYVRYWVLDEPVS
ncbi:MAG TPA: hypothetical protein VM681_07265 [Candidatus Thermoplasmatota archaeon]|nr:hypothetical protein [Candidatus Thermoplasmatota archaeon]